MSFILCCWENTRKSIQLQCTVIYFGFVSVSVSGHGSQGSLWRGGNIPCPGSSTQGTDAQASKMEEGSFLCVFAATQVLSGSQDLPSRTHRAVGDLLIKLLDVMFLTALLPPSPAWPRCCNSRHAPEHNFIQARWDWPCWGWHITGRQSSSWLSSQFSQDHHLHKWAHPLCCPPAMLERGQKTC